SQFPVKLDINMDIEFAQLGRAPSGQKLECMESVFAEDELRELKGQLYHVRRGKIRSRLTPTKPKRFQVQIEKSKPRIQTSRKDVVVHPASPLVSVPVTTASVTVPVATAAV
ncbi:unnamed protein product, partial [Allacma fusca]